MDSMTNSLIVIKIDDLEEVKSELHEIKELLKELFANNPIICMDEYISSKQTAQMLNISTRTLSEWMKKGVLKCHRVGRKLRFKRSDVIELLERNKINN